MLITNEYGENNGDLISSTYGNDLSHKYEYDNHSQLIREDNYEVNRTVHIKLKFGPIQIESA